MHPTILPVGSTSILETSFASICPEESHSKFYPPKKREKNEAFEISKGSQHDGYECAFAQADSLTNKHTCTNTSVTTQP